MKSVFIELPAFERHRASYLDDDKLYDKDEMSDLTQQQRKALKEMIKAEIDARRN